MRPAKGVWGERYGGDSNLRSHKKRFQSGTVQLLECLCAEEIREHSQQKDTEDNKIFELGARSFRILRGGIRDVEKCTTIYFRKSWEMEEQFEVFHGFHIRFIYANKLFTSFLVVISFSVQL